MNLNFFDNTDGMLLHDKERCCFSSDSDRKHTPSDSGMSRFPKNTPLAMAYVPFQEWGEVYDEENAFARGTLFPELDFPFERGEMR